MSDAVAGSARKLQFGRISVQFVARRERSINHPGDRLWTNGRERTARPTEERVRERAGRAAGGRAERPSMQGLSYTLASDQNNHTQHTRSIISNFLCLIGVRKELIHQLGWSPTRQAVRCGRSRAPAAAGRRRPRRRPHRPRLCRPSANVVKDNYTGRLFFESRRRTSSSYTAGRHPRRPTAQPTARPTDRPTDRPSVYGERSSRRPPVIPDRRTAPHTPTAGLTVIVRRTRRSCSLHSAPRTATILCFSLYYMLPPSTARRCAESPARPSDRSPSR